MKKLILLFSTVLVIGCNLKAQSSYEKSIETGYSIGIGNIKNNTFNIAMLNGYRFNSSFYLGVGVGFGYTNNLNGIQIESYSYTKEWRDGLLLIPIYVQAKINFNNEKISPFLLANVGYTIDGRQDFGFMFTPTFGIDFKIDNKQSIYTMVGFYVQNHKYSYDRNVSTYDWEYSTREENLTAVDVRIGFKF
jgi:hypothetical protein